MHVEIYQKYYSSLRKAAYQLCGSMQDAEDIVHDAYIEFTRIPIVDMRNPYGLFLKIVSRRSMDRLKKRSREEYFGPFLPEPYLPDIDDNSKAQDPAVGYEKIEKVSYAFMVMLEVLGPVERSIFILRELFQLDYSEIAEITDRSEPNCRKLLERAKNKLQQRRQNDIVSKKPSESTLLQVFLQSTSTGDLETLKDILHEEVVYINDGGGKVPAATRPVSGFDRVVKLLFGLEKKRRQSGINTEIRKIEIGEEAILILNNGVPDTLLLADTDGNRIIQIFALRNPEKLSKLTV